MSRRLSHSAVLSILNNSLTGIDRSESADCLAISLFFSAADRQPITGTSEYARNFEESDHPVPDGGLNPLPGRKLPFLYTRLFPIAAVGPQIFPDSVNSPMPLA